MGVPPPPPRVISPNGELARRLPNYLKAWHRLLEAAGGLSKIYGSTPSLTDITEKLKLFPLDHANHEVI